MNEVLHANIFFVIASVAFVILSLVGVLILWQVMKLVKAIRKIIERVEAGSEQIAADAAHMRQFVSQGGVFSKMIGIIMGAMATGQRRSRQEDED